MAEDSLLDVFVNVKIKDEILADTEKKIRESVRNMQAMFGTLNSTISTAGAAASRAGGGGSGGIGRGARGDLAAQYREAKRAAQDLAIETGRIGAVVRAVKSEELSRDFKFAAYELRDLITLMNRGREDADPLALEETIRRLGLVKRQLSEIATGSTGATLNREFIRERGGEFTRDEKQNKSNFQIDVGVRQQFLHNMSIQQRENLAKLNAEAKRTEFTFQRLLTQFLKTGEGLESLTQNQEKLALLRSEVLGMVSASNQSLQSVNALQNSAYQLGQAFEDASVGFSLNGIAGAVRGASNNLTFLVQNYAIAQARMAEAAGKPASALVGQLPLYAAIAASVGLLVVGPMSDWLASLDDISDKLSDIDKTIGQTVEDIDFSSGLRRSNEELLKTLKNATSVKDTLKQIEEINARNAANSSNLKELFGGLSASGDFQKALDDIVVLESQAKIARRQVSDFIEVSPTSATDSIGIEGFTQDALRRDQEIRKKREVDLKSTIKLLGSTRDAYRDLTDAQRAVTFGTEDQAEKVAKASESYRKLKKIVDEIGPDGKTSAGGVLSEEDAAATTSKIDAFGVQLEKIRKLSEEIRNDSVGKLPDALQAVVDKSDELSFGLSVARANTQGLVGDQALMVLELQKSNSEFRTMLNAQIELAKSRGVSQDLIDSANRSATTSQFDLNRIAILKEIKKREDEIAKVKDKKSTFTDLEKFQKELQVNVLGPEEKNRKSVEDLTKEIRQLNQLIEDFRKNRNENLKDLPQNPFDLSSELKNRQELFDRRLQSKILPFIPRSVLQGQDIADAARDKGEELLESIKGGFMEAAKLIVGSQDKTKEAVQDLDVGAKAQ